MYKFLNYTDYIATQRSFPNFICFHGTTCSELKIIIVQLQLFFPQMSISEKLICVHMCVIYIISQV